VTGFVKGRLISAQIDRLVVENDKVMIVDYKTNRPPPHDVADVPSIYMNQMNAYCDIVAEIYKDKTVQAYLLWTDGPFMMKMPS
jgi:ATP-dependent helicase/nuclease subunit A